MDIFFISDTLSRWKGCCIVWLHFYASTRNSNRRNMFSGWCSYLSSCHLNNGVNHCTIYWHKPNLIRHCDILEQGGRLVGLINCIFPKRGTLIYYLAPHRGRARYCNAHVCLSVCVFVRVFAKFQSVISQPFLNRSRWNLVHTLVARRARSAISDCLVYLINECILYYINMVWHLAVAYANMYDTFLN